DRLPSATPGLPPIQPMFAPTHRIPIAIAGYRRALVELAGRKADGYLARPAESIPSLRGILERLRAAASAAGRDPQSIETAGYLLTLVDKSSREALNRAKREPFVIYMMSVLSDVSLRRAGFDAELRDRIATAWRAEDYTTAGNLIPDEPPPSGRSGGRSPTPPRSSPSSPAARWRPSTAGSAGCRSSPRSPVRSCCIRGRTSSTRSTTSGRASTRSRPRARATPLSRAG